MKIRLGRRTITLAFGPVMWRCRDGAPNHAVEWWARVTAFRYRNDYSLPLLPTIMLRRWKKGVMSSDPNLGRVTHHLTIGVAWWLWDWSLMIGRNRHTERITHD